MIDNWRPNLRNPNIILDLQPRSSAYFNILEYCRHIGVEVLADGTSNWVARVRKRNGGYMRLRIGAAKRDQKLELSYEHAVELAMVWFERPEVSSVAADPYPLGSKRERIFSAR